MKFEGANQVVQLLVNNQEAGIHVGGYTGFVFPISKYVEYGRENKLTIVCDNSHSDHVPPYSADFTFYGGVYRDVELVVADIVHVEIDNDAAGK